MDEPMKEGGADPKAPGRVVTRRRHGRLRPPGDTLDSLAPAYAWGGRVGVLMELVTLRRVRRRIRESRQRRARRRQGIERASGTR